MTLGPSSDNYGQRLVREALRQNAPPPQEPAPPGQPPTAPADPIATALQAASEALTGAKTSVDKLAGGLKGQDAEFAKALGMLRKARLVAVPILGDDGGRSNKGNGKSLGGLWGKAAGSTASGLGKQAANKASAQAVGGQLQSLAHTLEGLRQAALANHEPLVATALQCACNDLKWGSSWEAQVGSRLDAVHTQAVFTLPIYDFGKGYVGGITGDKPGKNVSKPAFYFMRELDKVEPRISGASYDSKVTTNQQYSAGESCNSAQRWLQQAIVAHQNHQ